MSLITPDGGLLFWMVLIFGIVFFILAKWGFPIISSSVESRSGRIAESLRKADEIEAKEAAIGARTQIEAERVTAEAELRRQVAILSVEVAEKVIRDRLSSEKEQKALVDRLLEEASKAPGTAGPKN